MLKLQRPSKRPSKQRTKVDFRFSNFQALQVPKGWDKLFVSLVSVETGKTIAKSGKAVVRNGSCQWTETASESIYISRDDSSKSYDECLIKLVVSMGSPRLTTLGEATINVAHYTSSRVSSAVSQALKKCSYGTVIQVKIQCLSPRSKIRDEESKHSNSQEKDWNVDQSDTAIKSNVSDNSSENAVPLKLDSKEDSRSESGTFQSFDSQEGSMEGENLFVENAFKDEENNSSERRDVDVDVYLVDDNSPLNHKCSNSEPYLREDFRNKGVNRSTNLDSSKNLLEVAEDTIEELRAEAKMWERNARKLMFDFDLSRKEFSDLLKKQAELEMELSSACAEKDGLKREVEKLTTNRNIQKDPYHVVQSESGDQMRRELENEIKYQRDLNNNLDEQLKRSQESNVELISVLQELEETVEQQKIEIENLSSLKLESEKKLKADVKLLEEALRDKGDKLENELKSNSKVLFDVEKDYEYKLSVKEEEVARLKAALSGYEGNVDLIKEIELLREKVQELEKDCAELTDENLELVFKLKDLSKSEIRKCTSFDSITSEIRTGCHSDESEVSDPKFQVGSDSSEHFAEILKQLEMAFDILTKPSYGNESEMGNEFLDGVTNARKGNMTSTKMSAECILGILQDLNKLLETRIVEYDEVARNRLMEIKERNDIIDDVQKKMEERILEVQELEKLKDKNEENCANVMKELDQKRNEVHVLEANLLSKEQEIDVLVQHLGELEAEVSELQLEKSRLGQNMDISIGLREENMQLLECISGLKTRVTQLTDEKECCLKEMDNYKSIALDLQDEIEKLKVEMDVQISDLKRKSEDMQKEVLEAQEKCECLKEEIKTLHASAASFGQESTEMKRENQELHENCSALVAQLSETKESLSECTKRVELLEDHKERERVSFESSLREVQTKAEITRNKLNAALQESESKVQDLMAQLAASGESQGKLMAEHERILELLEDHKERERISFETSIQEVELKAEITKNKLDTAFQESDSKVKELTDQLAASEENHGKLMAEHERVLKSLSNYKKSEEKLKTNLNELELKLTISDYERQQLSKEISNLKVQLQNMSGLQDEISILKSELEGCRLDNAKLELVLETVSEDYEKLKADKISFTKKISIFQEAMSEFDECKRSKLELEEKLLLMEKELAAKEIICSQNDELKNELTEVKRGKMQLQQKMYMLEEEKDECLKKIQALEDELKLMEERYNLRKEDCLDHEVAEGLEVNNRNRLQHDRTSERYERTKSSLETELRDLRERYLEMSLKYAEVEARREDLVMKLRAARGVKRWFS
ncbi:E3 ubiquitin ligase involved in syntaxin degradation [Handroanthus impetiginosus]|uniref:E3 ubiquitin ligase involved in syntaxin degradation n=1 Tax=Handroanthus impetiginosus TaxID=429701 RepID=A0A2G9HVD7_9LAMI|nr:E3 ubiquitin ligase involved in syntaxin degradation [Handroanthus impetiginosus]